MNVDIKMIRKCHIQQQFIYVYQICYKYCINIFAECKTTNMENWKRIEGSTKLLSDNGTAGYRVFMC